MVTILIIMIVKKILKMLHYSCPNTYCIIAVSEQEHDCRLRPVWQLAQFSKVLPFTIFNINVQNYIAILLRCLKS